MKFFTAIIATLYAWVVPVHKVLAQDFGGWGMDNITGLNLGTRSLGETVAGVINIALGFLGIIALVIVLYGGFLWMTSNGNAERVQRAKLALISGLIGLAIIVSAYAIARFVLREFADATGVIDNVVDPGGGGVDPDDPLCPDPGDGSVVICTISPMARGGGSAVTIRGWNFGNVEGTVNFVDASSGDNADATIPACGGSSTWGDREITAIVPDTLIPDTDFLVTVNASAGSDTFIDSFEILAISEPSIFCLNPSTASIGSTVEIIGNGFYGTDGNWNIGDQVHLIVDDIAIDAPANSWNDERITFTVPDATSGNIEVIAEGLPSNPKRLRISCTADGQCASNCCHDTQDICVPFDPYCSSTVVDPDAPVINYIDPPDGAALNLVTIHGSGFGDDPGANGEVRFADLAVDVPSLYPGDINAACTADFWTDTWIIVGVPDTIPNGNYSVTVTNDLDLTSAGYGFDKNNTDRPGICQMAPNTGQFEQAVVVTGVGFDNTDVVRYGPIDDLSSSCNAASDTCTSNVPNLTAGQVTVQVFSDPDLSNTYPFIVQENLTGEPIITEITPQDRPGGQYVTIKGTNFGSTKGVLDFGGVTDDSLFDFPPQCQSSVWTNNQILAIVPDGGIGNINVSVTRSGDAAVSDPFIYRRGGGDPTPGVCAIVPNNGPIGYQPVTLWGGNFGILEGTVDFYNAVNATIIDPPGWVGNQTSNYVQVIVPNGAQSGDVHLYNAGGDESNPISFAVGACQNDAQCSVAGDVCCNTPGGNICLPSSECESTPETCEYVWEITSEEAPFGPLFNHCNFPAEPASGSPWPDGRDGISSDEVYQRVNASITFNRNIRNEDLVWPENFFIERCNNGAAFDFTQCNGVQINGNHTVINNGSNREGIMFTLPSGVEFENDYWYRVRLGDPAVGGTGFRAQVGGDYWSGTGLPNDWWTFRIRATDDVCYVDNVVVSPQSPQSDFNMGTSRTFNALPLAENCNICGNQYNWTWQETDNAANATLSVSPNPRNIGQAILYGDVPTENLATNYVGLEASVVNVEDGSTITGDTTAVIRAPRMEVIHHEPDCGDACLNSVVVAVMNTSINPATFDAGDITIAPAGGCVVQPLSTTNVANDTITVICDAFTSGTTYTATVGTGFENVYGYPLEADDNMRIWSFTIGENHCTVDSASIVPGGLSQVRAGNSIDYEVRTYSAPGICYPSGQQITCEGDCSWGGFNMTAAPGLANLVPDVANPNIRATVEALSFLPPPNDVGVITNIATEIGNPFSPFTVGAGFQVLPEPPPPVYSTPTVDSYLPPDDSLDLCIDTMATITFSEPMDISSVSSNFSLYFVYSGTVGVGGITCQNLPNVVDTFFPGYRVPGEPSEDFTWICRWPKSVTAFDNGRMFIVNSGGDRLLENLNYIVGVNGGTTGVLSANGVRLADSDITGDIDGDGINDGFYWNFSVGDDDCIPNGIHIIPPSHTFTCAHNNCIGDDLPATPGNQELFVALTHDIRGNYIYMPESAYAFDILNDYVQMTPVDFGNPGYDGVYVDPIEAANNALDFLHVTVTDPEPPNDVVTGLAPIELFMCEKAWPDPIATGDLEWEDIEWNFATRYCQYDGPGDTLLPALPYEPIESPNPPGGPGNILVDYLLIVNPLVAQAENNSYDGLFGTLALEGDTVQDNSWLNKFTYWRDRLFSVQAQIPLCTPSVPRNLEATVVGGTDVYLDWMPPLINPDWDNDPTAYRIRRIRYPNSLEMSVSIPATQTDYIDFGGINQSYAYRYEVAAYNADCDSGWREGSPAEVNIGNVGEVDAIGVRVMSNPEHLSIDEWYQRNAPNPGAVGRKFLVDGYEAMQVGNTVYIAGTNVIPGEIWTNIYILSYSQGAAGYTIDIFNQLIENFELNSNWSDVAKGTNHCNIDTGTSCSNDFDCVVEPGDYCNSRALKLRRDIGRMGDLFDTDKYLYAYGVQHMACQNDENNDGTYGCPGGAPIEEYYPRLNAGSFVQGVSNSEWPSWSQTLAAALGENLPVDPIGKFNGCPEGVDPNTCWSESELTFYCPLDSLIYYYEVDVDGQGYTLGANFEYDQQPMWGTTFGGNLRPNPMPANISTDLGAVCSDVLVENPPGGPSSYCGNGILDPGEECDGGNPGLRNACVFELGNLGWWNPVNAGCWPAGTQYECTYYEYTAEGGYSDAAFAGLCGGYCGDNIAQPFYEQCENVPPGGVTYFGTSYTCGGVLSCDTNAGINDTCQALCDGQPAGICGDGILSAGEACDPTANPNGLGGWDCSEGDIATCSNTCQPYCSGGIGELYEGLCGDGIVADPLYEDCDYYNYITPTPDETVEFGVSYECGTDCRYNGEFCGDGADQYDMTELCDPLIYNANPPDPEDSHEFWQYACRATYIDPWLGSDGKSYGACTPTDGGWCGDGVLQASEFCDVTDPADAPTPLESRIDNQYSCDSTCSSINGGWCGDGIVHDGDTQYPNHGLDYGEQCDEGETGTDYGVCRSDTCAWLCDPNGNGSTTDDTDPENIGHAPLRFSGSATVTLEPGESTIVSLPACRASDKITFDMDVTAGVEVPDTAVIFVTDLSYSMGYCTAGWTPAAIQPGSSWTCPENSPNVAQPLWTFWATDGQTTTYTSATGIWNPYTPAGAPAVFEERIISTADALASAINEVFVVNNQADVSLVDFAGTVIFASTTPGDMSTAFFPNTELATLLNKVDDYPGRMRADTRHDLALNRVQELINASDYDNYVVIFMTDGECNKVASPNCYADSITLANTLRNGYSRPDGSNPVIDIFGISLVNPQDTDIRKSNIRGFMNGITSNNCTPTWSGDSIVAGGSCGDNTVDCVSLNAGVYTFEQCDDNNNINGDGCSATCQVESQPLQRFYDYEFEGGDLSSLYSYIAGTIPLAQVTINIDGQPTPVVVPEGVFSVEGIEVDTSFLYPDRCNEFSGNYFVLDANFAGGTEGTTITLKNAEYVFCPWTNGNANVSYY